MKLSNGFKKVYKRALMSLAGGIMVFVAVITATQLMSSTNVRATTPITDSGDWGTSAMIKGGVTTPDQIITKYDADPVLRDVYGKFGITRDGLVKMKAQWGAGGYVADVYNDTNELMIHTKVIGYNAETAGHDLIGQSSLDCKGAPNCSTIMTQMNGQIVYRRPYSLSNHSRKQAFYLADGDHVLFAIIAECGNPIKVDTPNVSIEKSVSKDGVNYSKNVSITDGQNAFYKITVRETTGKAKATVVHVTDALPQGLTLSGGAYSSVNDIDLGTIAAGGTKEINFQATVKLVGKTCGANDINNIATVDTDNSNPVSDNAVVNVSKACPSPTVTCNALNANRLTANVNDVVTMTAVASDASLVDGYIFSVDGMVVQNNSSNTYAYKVAKDAHTVRVDLHGKPGVVVTQNVNCAKQITGVEEQKLYVACSSLTIAPIKSTYTVGDVVTFTAAADFPDRVASFNWTGATDNGITATRVITAGNNTVSVTVGPKAGVLPAAGITCTKTVTGVEVPKYVKCESLTSDKATYKVGETATYTAAADFPDRVASFNWTGATDNGITATRVITAGNNTVSVTIGAKPGFIAVQSPDCTKTVTGVEEPKLYVACESLTSDKVSYKVGDTAIFTAKADYPDRVASYVWTGAKGAGTYADLGIAKGTNKVTVTITAKPGFILAQATCEKTVTGEEVKVPVYSCDSLDIVVRNGREVSVTTHATAQDGAMITGYSYDYTDGTVNVNSHTVSPDTDSHTYATGGKHNIIVTVKFMVNGVAKTAVCQTSVDCEHPPVKCDVDGKKDLDITDAKCKVDMCAVKGKEALPKNSADCVENCTVKGKETLLKTNPECKEVLGTTTTVLPDTGAGNMIGLFAGVSVAGAMMHRMIAARKFNR